MSCIKTILNKKKKMNLIGIVFIAISINSSLLPPPLKKEEEKI